MNKIIFSKQELLSHLADPEYVIIDCRYNLSDPQWGYRSYCESHIPGAIYADLNKNLSSSPTIHSGRHPLPDQNEFIAFLSKIGVNLNKNVVVYDTAKGSMAARLWWMLRSFGHVNTTLLDGDFSGWLQEDYPISKVPEWGSPTKFSGIYDSKYEVDMETIRQNLHSNEYLLIDARAPERYRGEIEPIDPVAGHIPGAINWFYENNLDDDGYFLPPARLNAMIKNISEGVSAEKMIVYCGSGVTSCLNVAAFEYAGFSGARLFVPSWSGWCSYQENPVSLGDERKGTTQK